ncbi:MAG: 1,2-phenylacetyl-CoA epoxidase subunit PaaE [Bacteroidota bacterium]
MSSSFYSLPVKDIYKTTEDCAVVEFEIAEALKETFQYQQGQYLTLKAVIDGEEVRRSYSLCSSPLDDSWKVAVKKIEGGKFSTFANDILQVGDRLEVMPPNGRFFVPVAPEAARTYVAFAAGSGITPILSIIRTHLEEEPEARFKLFYTNQSVASIILKEEIEALKNEYLERFEIFHFLTKEARSTPLFNGRINLEKLDIICKALVNLEEADHFFICGPNEMIFMIRDFLLEKGVDEEKVHFELFNTSGIKQGTADRYKDRVSSGKMTELSILEGGKTFTFSLPQGSNNILDAALQQAADLPFACKGGVCCTCRAKLLEGEVDMAVNYALEKEEVEAGYILTCQAVPLSEKVVVDFDS